jgi:hypothetical protein
MTHRSGCLTPSLPYFIPGWDTAHILTALMVLERMEHSMPDKFEGYSEGMSNPLTAGFPIVPSDSVDVENVTRQIRITGAGGNIAVIWSSGTSSVEPVATRDVLDWRIRRVLATGTTATGIRGYF